MFSFRTILQIWMICTFKGAYLVHMQPWCTYAHMKSGPFISYPTITHLFSFQPSHMFLGAYLLHMECERVETKKMSYRWMRDDRPKFNICICAPDMFPTFNVSTVVPDSIVRTLGLCNTMESHWCKSEPESQIGPQLIYCFLLPFTYVSAQRPRKKNCCP
jgi:hypothetical protein